MPPQSAVTLPEWLEVTLESRELIWTPEWTLEEDWDQLRVQVETKGRGFEIESEVPIMLLPSDAGMEWVFHHNLFNNLLAELGLWRALGTLFVVVFGGCFLWEAIASHFRRRGLTRH